MSLLLSQLMRFVSGTKPWHAVPFSLKVKKVAWSVGTDGHVLLAFKLPGATPRKDYPKELPDLLTVPIENQQLLDLEELKTWAGAPPTSLIPGGDVVFEHQGVLLGQVIDRRKLAYLLAKIVLPKVVVWVVRPGLLGFENPTGQWRALLACLDSGPDGDEPVFESKPAVSMFELIEELGSE
jgi:hypothetical protein